ncbi:MAG TPA: hypothetical protein VMC86_06770 [Gemmatimonadales bacterium]|nr:hypothetical protein [Gemmatimonadales bacterium]
MPTIDYVDGAVQPILSVGQTTVIEGFGFGAAPGAGGVTFAGPSGGTVAAAPDTAGWSDEAIRVVVPAGAASGTLTVHTGSGGTLTASVYVVPQPAFDAAGFTWHARTGFPQAPVGVAVAAAEWPASGGGVSATLYAAGGAEPIGGDSAFLPDSGVYVAPVQSDFSLGAWVRQHDTTDAATNHTLPLRLSFAAAVVATPYNSRLSGNELIVIGGMDSAGNAQSTVFAASVTPSAVTSAFVAIEPLPNPVAGAIAVARRGRIYVLGGVDSSGHPQSSVYVGRVGPDGHIDGWYTAPPLSSARAYGGGVILDDRLLAFGGIADSADDGGGLDATPSRLVTSDTATISLVSGFFLSTAWAPGASLLPEGRSQFAVLPVGSEVLVVGGVCDGGVACPSETLAAGRGPDSVGAFQPAGGNTIAGLGGGVVTGLSGATWRAGDGSYHGVVVGGMDLTTRLRLAGVWGF